MILMRFLKKNAYEKKFFHQKFIYFDNNRKRKFSEPSHQNMKKESL